MAASIGQSACDFGSAGACGSRHALQRYWRCQRHACCHRLARQRGCGQCRSCASGAVQMAAAEAAQKALARPHGHCDVCGAPSADAVAEHFFRHLWSAKESVLKARGDGLTLPPSRVSFELPRTLPMWCEHTGAWPQVTRLCGARCCGMRSRPILRSHRRSAYARRAVCVCRCEVGGRGRRGACCAASERHERATMARAVEHSATQPHRGGGDSAAARNGG